MDWLARGYWFLGVIVGRDTLRDSMLFDVAVAVGGRGLPGGVSVSFGICWPSARAERRFSEYMSGGLSRNSYLSSRLEYMSIHDPPVRT